MDAETRRAKTRDRVRAHRARETPEKADERRRRDRERKQRRRAPADGPGETGPEPCAAPAGRPAEERLNELANTAFRLSETLTRAENMRLIRSRAGIERNLATARTLARELAEALCEPGA